MALIHTIINGAGVVLFVVFFFGFCVFIHEFGHLLAAKWRGLHVESFSIGFGKKIWGFTHKGVMYKVSMLPFGGYVELPQLETADEHSDARGNPLPAVKPIDRMITAVAGPLFNILFGLFLGSFIWIFGVDAPPPGSEMRVVHVAEDSVEYAAGLRRDDVIFSVNGESFEQGWLDVRDMIMTCKKENVTLGILRDGKQIEPITYPLRSSEIKMAEGLPLPSFSPATICEVAEVEEGSPAGKAGVQAGDEYISINGEEIFDGSGVTLAIRNAGGKKLSIIVNRKTEEDPIGKSVSIGQFDAIFEDEYNLGLTTNEKGPLRVAFLDSDSPLKLKAKLRKGDEVVSVNSKTFKTATELNEYINKNPKMPFVFEVKRLIKKADLEEEKKAVYAEKSELLPAVTAFPIYIAGLKNGTKNELVTVYPTPFQQMTTVVSRTWRTVQALTSSKSKVSIKHMSGPIGIAKVMGQAVSRSFMTGLSLVVFISFSLALMNLLPLPVLDGGHITFSFIELVSRRKLPVKIISKLEFLFAIMLIGFMLYVTIFSDAKRLLPDGEEQKIEYRRI